MTMFISRRTFDGGSGDVACAGGLRRQEKSGRAPYEVEEVAVSQIADDLGGQENDRGWR